MQWDPSHAPGWLKARWNFSVQGGGSAQRDCVQLTVFCFASQNIYLGFFWVFFTLNELLRATREVVAERD